MKTKLNNFKECTLNLEDCISGGTVVNTTYEDCDGNSGGSDTWDGYEMVYHTCQ